MNQFPNPLIDENKLINRPCIHILVSYETPRMYYTFDFIFKYVFGLNYQLHRDADVFIKIEGHKINYLHNTIAADMHIESAGVLYEFIYADKYPHFTHWRNLPVLFQTHSRDLPFDIFSAVFYMLCRFEEYAKFQPDIYYRYPHYQSINHTNGILQMPIVDLWLYEFRQIIEEKFHIQTIRRSFNFLPTYDIDIAYHYKGKGLIRNLGGAIKHPRSIPERLRVLAGWQSDPYDAYDWLDALHDKYQLAPIYFMLVSLGSKFDRNLDRNGKTMKALIERLHKRYTLGIHPSWLTHSNFNEFEKEFTYLPQPVLHSRMHYIRYNMPEMMNDLTYFKVPNDYTMGYGTVNGFRAGTSYPFQFYNLDIDRVSKIIIHPFCYMECNSFFELHHSPDEAFDELMIMLAHVKKVGGQMITIWHNFSLGTAPMWKGWREMYAKFVDRAMSS